jgi:hypothetical protein
MNSITLGQKVRDEVTGFTGIAVVRAEYLDDTVSYCVQPEVVQIGVMPESHYIDSMRLHVVPDDKDDSASVSCSCRRS